MSLFRKKAKKKVIALNLFERRLMMNALLEFRNMALQTGKPTEDIERLLLMVAK